MWWSSFPYAEDDRGPFNRSIEYAALAFKGLAANFSPGLAKLLEAHAQMEPYGLRLLPIPDAAIRTTEDLRKHVKSPRPAVGASIHESTIGGLPDNFDLALSFAGTERRYAEALAETVRAAGFAVFYDDFYPVQLGGKNLYEFFHQIYSKRARFCVMFVSKAYFEREWTNHERQCAQERMLKEKGREYLLPIRIDDTELPGLLSTVAYMPIHNGIDAIAAALIDKLRQV